MPRMNGTGPLGKGPMSGRGRGRVQRPLNKRQGSTKECTCPKCGHRELNPRGIPCTELKCPKCGTPMKGEYCI